MITLLLVTLALLIVLALNTVKQADNTRTISLGFGFAVNIGTLRVKMVTRRVIFYRKAIKGLRPSRLILLVGTSHDGAARKFFARTDLGKGYRYSVGRSRAVELV